MTMRQSAEGKKRLVCEVRANPHVVDFTWMLDNTTLTGESHDIQLNGVNSVLTLDTSIYPITGVVYCYVNNSVGVSTPCQISVEGMSIRNSAIPQFRNFGILQFIRPSEVLEFTHQFRNSGISEVIHPTAVPESIHPSIRPSAIPQSIHPSFRNSAIHPSVLPQFRNLSILPFILPQFRNSSTLPQFRNESILAEFQNPLSLPESRILSIPPEFRNSSILPEFFYPSTIPEFIHPSRISKFIRSSGILKSILPEFIHPSGIPEAAHRIPFIHIYRMPEYWTQHLIIRTLIHAANPQFRK